MVEHYLSLTPKWVDGTAVGGCSFMIHVRHAAAAIASGLCETVLITHGESGRSGVGRTRNVVAPPASPASSSSLMAPGRPALRAVPGAPTLFTIPVLRYMILPSPPESGGPGASDEAPSPGFPLARERRNKGTSNCRWSRSCSANGPQGTRAPPSRRQRFPRLAWVLGDDLKVGGRWRVRLAAALFPILQRR
jgi:hypothetical protein